MCENYVVFDSRESQSTKESLMDNQSLVGLVVIVTELGRENHSSISTTLIGKDLKPFDIKTDAQTKLDDPMDLIPMVKKKSTYRLT
jgi:hypothetical protein